MTRDRTTLVAGVLAALLGFAPAPAADEAQETADPVWITASRPVVVTDSFCGVDGVREGHRRCALESTTKGASLIFYDPRREALYTIEYPSEDLYIKVLNDFAGLPAWAQGQWDDENHVVRLVAIYPPPERGGVRPLREETP